MGKYQSGQMGQTVNLLSFDFGGSNQSLPTKNCGSSSVDRALAFQVFIAIPPIETLVTFHLSLYKLPPYRHIQDFIVTIV